MSKGIVGWVSPKGRFNNVSGGSRYRTTLSVFINNENLLDLKAACSVEQGRIIGIEEYLALAGYIYFDGNDKDCVQFPATELTGTQRIFIRAFLKIMSPEQQAFLLEKGLISQEQIDDASLDYYNKILKDISKEFEQTIADTYGNTHDFNRDHTNIKYAIRKIAEELSKPEEGGDSEALALSYASLRHQLTRFHAFCAVELVPILVRERLLKLELENRNSDYYKEKIAHMRKFLGIEVADEVGAAQDSK